MKQVVTIGRFLETIGLNSVKSASSLRFFDIRHFHYYLLLGLGLSVLAGGVMYVLASPSTQCIGQECKPINYSDKNGLSDAPAWTTSWNINNWDILLSVEEIPNNGGFLVGGFTGTSITSGQDAYIAKLKSDTGSILWQRISGGNDQDWITDVMVDSSGNYLGVGRTSSIGITGSNHYGVKLNPNGAVLWERAFQMKGFESTYSIIEDVQNGGYILGGWNHGDAGVDSTIFKITSDGKNVLWAKYYGRQNCYPPDISPRCFPEEVEDLYMIQRTPDGGYIISGYKQGPLHEPENYDFWLMRLDSNFGVLWSKTYDGGRTEAGISGFPFEHVKVTPTPDGGFVFGGSTLSFSLGTDGDLKYRDMLVIKVDSAGTMQWAKRIYTPGGNSVDRMSSLTSDNFGYVYITGVSGNKDLYVAKLRSADGSMVWQKQYGTGIGRDIKVTADGKSMIIVGTTWSNTNLNFVAIRDAVTGDKGTPIPVTSVAVAEVKDLIIENKIVIPSWSYTLGLAPSS